MTNRAMFALHRLCAITQPLFVIARLVVPAVAYLYEIEVFLCAYSSPKMWKETKFTTRCNVN